MDPERWSTSVDAPAEIRALLRAARAEAPGPEVTARLDERLSGSPRGAPGSVTLPGWIVPSGLVLALTVGLAAAWISWGGRGARAGVERPAQQPARMSAAAEPSPIREARVAGAARRGEEVAPRPKSEVQPTAVSAPSELELIREARRTLHGAPGESLRWSERHRRLYPAGRLAQEREVLAVEALTRLGRSEEAEARAKAFAARHPSSAHKARVERETSGKPSESERPASTHRK